MRLWCVSGIGGVHGLSSLTGGGGKQTVGDEYGGPGGRQTSRKRPGSRDSDNELAEDGHGSGQEKSVVVVRDGTGEWFGLCSTATGQH